ncbi:hypothetical protein FJZ31_25125, partial [Candidatus Poribacteria bacterium]|nr:hypothetical protein [Candidatus Poribacteria bacterium]
DWTPSWSPDGKKIAFASYRDGNGEIYVMNADGTNPIRLTNHPTTDWNPCWSPDGTKIAFASMRDGDYQIYVMNADGTNIVKLTNPPGENDNPSWSPVDSFVVSPSGKLLPALWGEIRREGKKQ